MTLPSSGSLILGYDGTTTNNISNEFSSYPTVVYNDMASYLGVYYGKSGNEYRFPLPGNKIDMNGFYGTNKITGGSINYNSSGSVTVPVYNNLTITVHGGDGGQAGHYGNGCFGPSTYNWNAGSSGNVSSYGGYLSAAGGGGGGGDGTGGYSGSTTSANYNNPIQGGNGPTSGSSIYVTVGSGGSGGNGGANSGQSNYGCVFSGNAAGGNPGASGYVSISWS